MSKKAAYSLLFSLLFLLVGQVAVADPYTTSHMEFTGFSTGAGHAIRCQGFIFWSSGAQEGNSHVFDGKTAYKDGDRRGTFTVDGTINLAENNGYTDVTTGSKVVIRFESDKYYFYNASVSKLDDTPVEGVSVAGGGENRNWIQVTIPQWKTFGKINLVLYTHVPLKVGATISGIDEVYINDHVNRPEPIVTHTDPGNPPVLLTKGVDYTVSYTKNDKPGTATVTVTGMGDYIGTISKDFTIRDLNLADDLTKLGTNIYAISSQKDLDNLAVIVNEGNDCAGITLRQTADIAYTDNGKGLPIGMDGKPFRGTYDGQNHIISGLVVNNNGTFEPDGERTPYYRYHLCSGLFGKLDGATVRNVRLVSPVIKNTPNVSNYMSGFTEKGYMIHFFEVVPDVKLWYHSAGIAACIQNGSMVSNCYVYQPTFVFGKDDNSSDYRVFQQASAPIVFETTESTQGANAQVYKATAGSFVTFAKSTIIDGNGFIYSSKRYYKANAGIAVNYTGPAPGDGNYVAFTDDDGNLLSSSGSGTAYVVSMPDRDVTIKARILSASQFSLTAHIATRQGLTGYWATFYHGTCRFRLPEGAKAYTMGADYNLYRLGDDGRTIPAGVAVVILADKANLTLEKADGTSPISIHGGSNILRGSNSDVDTSGISGDIFVLGLMKGQLEFYQYTGSIVPANKAYYVR